MSNSFSINLFSIFGNGSNNMYKILGFCIFCKNTIQNKIDSNQLYDVALYMCVFMRVHLYLFYTLLPII